jgi:hypothetical protein
LYMATFRLIPVLLIRIRRIHMFLDPPPPHPPRSASGSVKQRSGSVPKCHESAILVGSISLELLHLLVSQQGTNSLRIRSPGTSAFLNFELLRAW